ncbi:hypothetical protein ACFO3U_02760 [Flavobacterium ponti]|uniref:DUF1735 domain-containing protein n=1 Tax=Flavobacterium ponti TaxID=665133 RepID=A0ABV9P2K7_9FLAO
MKKILSLFAISAVLFSCTDDDIRIEHQLNTGSKIVGFSKSFETVSYFVDEGAVQLGFPVNLIGSGNGQTLSEPIEVQYEVDAANSTATEGVEFDFVSSTGKVTIPAGGTFGEFLLNVNTGQLNPTMKTELVVKLTAASNSTVVGAQYQTLKVIFVGCKSLIAGPTGVGNYNLVVTRPDLPGSVWNFSNEAVTETSVNNFVTTRSGNYDIGVLQGNNTGYDFVDICNEITIPEQNLAHIYSNILRPRTANNGIDGTVTDINHFQTNYEIGFTGNTVWRTFNCVYTRI